MKTSKLNEHGAFAKEAATEKDLKDSELSKFIHNESIKKDNLIIEKLKFLSTESNIPFEELKQSFDLKVKNLEAQLKAENDSVLNKIKQFTNNLASLNNDKNLIVKQILDNLFLYEESLNESPLYKFIYDLDPKFAQSLSNVIKLNPTQESVDQLVTDFNNSVVSKLSDEQYNELSSLLSQAAQQQQQQQLDEPIDGETVVETIFTNLNSYEDIKKAPLFVLIKEIDPSFAQLLESYSTVDSNNDDLLNSKYDEIWQYCSNKESLIFKAFDDINSENFQKLKSVLEQPLPIDLSELYEVFEIYPDYFQSDLFKTIKEIDDKFANLLVELETLPEGDELNAKNNEIDEYLSNESTEIYKAMNDVESVNYNKLKEVLNNEWIKMESTLTTDKLINYSISNGLESDGFKLISKIDSKFANLISQLYNEKNEENAVKIYNDLENYLNNEENYIMEALNDKSSLNYKLLEDIIFEKEVQDIQTEQVEGTTTEEEVEQAINSTAESNLSQDVKQMNESYDLAIEILNEIEEELKDNTFIPVSRKVSQKLDKLLGFQPTVEQVNNSNQLKGKSLPKQTDEVLELAVNIIMKDGKKETARKHLNRALYLLFLETRSNPVETLKEALDIVAPIVVTKTVKTGFAKNFTVPVPLTQRQRNRMALLWILKSCDSKASNDFSVRLCDEILHVLGGKSALMEKRVLSHKMAIANRSYLTI